MNTSWIRPIAIDQIDQGNRLRPVDADVVSGLAVSFGEVGMQQPIVVRPTDGGRFVLVVGAHRLAATALLGWTTIEATIRADLTEATAALIEIDENLIRRELGPLDRAIFLAKRKEAWDAAFPETKHGGDRKSLRSKGRNQVAKMATRFSKDAAEKLGLSERVIRRAILTAERLTPEARALARQCYVAEHQSDLIKVALMEPDQQIIALSRIAGGEVKSLRAVIAPDRGQAAHDAVARLIDQYSRLGAKEQDRFLTAIQAARIPPAAQKVA